MKVAFYTLGCKLNQAETESVAGQFSQAGYQLVAPNSVADIYVANTCTVTHVADRKSRHWLRLARRRNPQAFIIATGCYAQRVPHDLAQLADLVLNNEEKKHLLEIVKGLPLRRPEPFASCHSDPEPFAPCHSEGAKRLKNLAQGKLREGEESHRSGQAPRLKNLLFTAFRASAHQGKPCSERSESIHEEVAKHPFISFNPRARSLIKIQDGCHSPCAYCIVPKVRPHEYSLPAFQIIGDIKQKVVMGYKEVVLTGTKVGCYKDPLRPFTSFRVTKEGCHSEPFAPCHSERSEESHLAQDKLREESLAGANLDDLIKCILHDTNIERLRLSSLQPQEISPKLLSLWQDERLCRHFHLALQSGNDTVLQRMRRRYSLDDYQRAINLIREAIPQMAITTDVMVGFPGESDEEFEQSYRFCQQAGFANIHVFPFSLRPGTEAAKMPDQVNDKVKNERTQRMLELAGKCRHSFCQQFIGEPMRVLWEKETNLGRGIYSGLTDNYIRVFTQSQEPLTNKIAVVRLTGFHDHGMWGELVD